MAEEIISPRLAALARALEAGEPGALDAFWRSIAEQGPLVEPVAGDDGQVLLTFLWRAREPVDNVVVWGGPAGWDLANNRMARLGDTDVWYLTCRVRSDARTTYRLSPDDSLAPLHEGPDWKARTANWRPDPVNPSTFVFPKDEEDPDDVERVVSVIELPGAPPQPWVAPRPGVPCGTVTEHRVRSDVLQNERRVWVYTPPDYRTDTEPNRLLLLFDGDACIRLIPARAILDNLLAEGRIPPVIAVLVDSMSQEVRDRELPCHPPFVDFLTQELLPWCASATTSRVTRRTRSSPVKLLRSRSSLRRAPPSGGVRERAVSVGLVLVATRRRRGA